jgi:predicted aldo/keto reductase-like oxidoreductase
MTIGFGMSGIPYRRLGRTGEMVSLIGVGGYHLGRQTDEQEAIRIIRTAIDNGINFLDNCTQDGKSELYKTTHHFDGTYQNPQWLG